MATMTDSMRCPYCGNSKLPYGGEPVCGEDYCPRNHYADDLDDQADDTDDPEGNPQ